MSQQSTQPNDIKIIEGIIHCTQPGGHPGPKVIPKNRDRCGTAGHPPPRHFQRYQEENKRAVNAGTTDTSDERGEGPVDTEAVFRSTDAIHEQVIKDMTPLTT